MMGTAAIDLQSADRKWHTRTPEQMASCRLPESRSSWTTAAWCVTCHTTGHGSVRPGLLDRFAADGVVLLRADWTLRDPR